jgi:ribosomal protein L37AE/L43A
VNIKICPNCGSKEVYMIAGSMTGTWMCKNCGHVGPVFEKEIVQSEQRTHGKKNEKEKKKK